VKEGEGRLGPALFSANRLAALWCRVVGHDWKALMGSGHVSVCMVCLRCRENGWRL
jgi:hypothetical protein